MCNKIKASCMAVVMYLNPNHIQATIIHHSGGIYGEQNLWLEEIDNSTDISDIFFHYEQPPRKPGFYVWEGELEPVHEDQPGFYGKWRDATKEDMISLVEVTGNIHEKDKS